MSLIKTNENGEKEQVPFTIDHSKKNIIMDEVLGEYADSLCDHIIEVKDIEEINDTNLVCICSIDKGITLGNYEMFKMTWGHTFEQNSISRDSIKKMEFCNNLDSVVDYDEFNMPLMFVFPLLECIRLNCKSENIYFVGDSSSHSMVYTGVYTN